MEAKRKNITAQTGARSSEETNGGSSTAHNNNNNHHHIKVPRARMRGSSKGRSGWPMDTHRLTPTRISGAVKSHLLLQLLHLSTAVVVLISQHQVNAQDQPAITSTTNSNNETITTTTNPEASGQVSPIVSDELNPQSSASSGFSAASCFGGLQIFEKISMSSFENSATGANSAGSFVNGVLIQQDDQALTSECLNICRSQSNCLSFVIDYSKFECKSYATTQQELQQELESKFQLSRSLNDSNTRNDTSEQPQASASTMQASHLLPSASSNYFEKVCLDGIANRNQFSDICGQGRLWPIERMVDSFLDGYVEKEMTNVNSKDECSKLCIFETQFVCRSADYDQRSRLCRLSREDRRTQPQAMRSVPGSNRQYLENQCATPGPSTCVYETKKNVGIISMDALKFAQSVQDCQMKCNQETTFNCRSYSFHQQRCFLSGDDSSSLNSNLIRLPQRSGWQFGEKKCLVELCSKGVFSYEKTTGFTLRSALATSIDLMMPSGSNIQFAISDTSSIGELDQDSSQAGFQHLIPTLNPRNMINGTSSSPIVLSTGEQASDPLLEAAASPRHRRSGSNNLAITQQCRNSCDLGYLNCPAFIVDYRNNRCQRLDRNSQGRHHELVPRDGFSYYEKICLRVPEIMSMCQDKFWIFERVLGHELAPHLYEKSLKFVQSRRDCEEYCLAEKQFQCRSALYNDETSDCKLSTYDRRLANQVGGFYRNFNARINYLENQCIRDQSSDRRQLQCYYEQTRDDSSYPTFTERIEMVPVPSTTGSSRGSDASSYQGANSNISSLGVSYCKQLCNANENFECHSFGYYSSTAQCFLSGDDTTSAGDSAASSSTGFTFYEKKCRFSGGNETSPYNPDPASMGYDRVLPPKINPSLRPTLDPQNPYFHQPNRKNNSQTTVEDNTRPSISNTNISIHIDQQMNNFPMQHSTFPKTDPGSSNQSESSTNVPSSGPDQYKCGYAHSFVYQRISGFEPIGGYLTLLVRDNDQPGIVANCADLCKQAYECRAFVVDYNSNQCYAMLENSSVGLLSLRQTIGKDYFEGFCIADHLLVSGNFCANKTWIADKIVDQAVVGVQHQRLIPESDRIQCRQACLEERLFYCKSAMYDGASGECKLFSIDRESVPQMKLLFTRGVDFYENQCQITSNTCPYDAIERDMTIVTATKSIQARSTFECEHACNGEVSFNCRSYTYMDQNPSLPNLCILSSDSRSTSQRGSVRERSKTLYAERNCFYRRPRYPFGSQSDQQDSANLVPSPPADVVPESDPYQPIPHTKPIVPIYNLDPYGGTRTHDAGGLVEPNLGPAPGQACEPHQYTFERTFGYDFRLAQKERVSIQTTVSIAIECQQECLKRDKCQSFVVEYSFPHQSCFLIDTMVGANKKLLIKTANSAYFEKICLPRVGVDPETLSNPSGPLIHGSNSYDTMRSYDSPTSIENLTPGYASDSWIHPPASQNHLPYYLQQQQLVQNYPSRSCAKLWSFERFVNHNFTAPIDKIFERILSRAHCQTLCINEASFSCRSGTYDYTNKICRLFKNTRRTIMSQFVDLESSTDRTTADSNSNNSSQANVATGTAHVLTGSGEVESLAVASSSQVPTMNDSTNPSKRQAEARQLIQTAEASSSQRDIDYFENTCVPEPSSCQYRQMYDLFSPYIDKITHAISLGDCQRQCDLERLFSCKSINYDPSSKKCMLINEDLISLNRGGQQTQALITRRGSVYSEKGNCEMINVQCNSHEMLVSINFDSPFRGRIMAKGNPDQCYMLGDGQTNIHFPIVFGPKCNSRQEGHNTFTNEIVIQQHPVIMTESDKTVRVMCAFEAPEQTITLKNPTSRDNKTGIDVGAPEGGRTRNEKQKFSSVVSSKAPPPSVLLRILDYNNRDASKINLGDDLILKIQMQMDGKNSALSIFARNLIARSSSGESLLLIDNDGCPVDPHVFPALELDPKDGKSLYTPFKAFRFPSSGPVNFEVQVRFCPEKCQPIECNKGHHMRSYGRRKRRDVDPNESANPLSIGRTSVFQSVDNPPELIGSVMKPGKAFQFVRELMLPKQAEEDAGSQSEGPIDQPSIQDSAEVTETRDQNSVDEVKQNEADPVSTRDPQRPETDDVPSDGNKGHEPTYNQATQKSILTHLDEKVSPPINTIMSHHQAGQGKHSGYPPSIPIAPYGRFPVSTAESDWPNIFLDSTKLLNDSVRSASPIWTSDPIGRPIRSDIDASKSNGPKLPESTQTDPEIHLNRQTQNLDPVEMSDEPSRTNDRRIPLKTNAVFAGSESTASSKDIPLKFSILVDEKQPQVSGWNPTGPPMVVMNSTDIDMDHIVIPGKDGQLEQASTNDSKSQLGVGSSTDSSEAFKSGAIDAKSRPFYDQTLDALSSSDSITEDRRLHGDATRKLITRSNSNSISETAASHDCHVESGRSKLWTIIWTGTFVIAINICLVLLSLIFYFRRAHSSQNHNIVFGTPDCRTENSRRRYRWPTVQLKSKNDLGTSLNTHEHFFCKLNSKSNGSPGISNVNDFNWTSTNSSQSTLSSVASPFPSTSLKVNQSRLQRYPFDLQPSSRHNLGLGCVSMGTSDANPYEGSSNPGYSHKLDE